MEIQLKSRPVYVSTKETLFWNILIVYFALVIIHLIEFKAFNYEIHIEHLFKATYLKIIEKFGPFKLEMFIFPKRKLT